MNAFKTVNGLMFVVLGAAIAVQMVRYAGLRLEAVPGLILGAAMFSLGVHRTWLVVRARR